jgi:type III secretion system YseE family protein
MTGERARLLGLEDALAADEGGRHLAHLHAELEAGRREVRRRIDRGLPPEEFQRQTRLREAIEAAEAVIDKLARRLAGQERQGEHP